MTVNPVESKLMHCAVTVLIESTAIQNQVLRLFGPFGVSPALGQSCTGLWSAVGRVSHASGFQIVLSLFGLSAANISHAYILPVSSCLLPCICRCIVSADTCIYIYASIGFTRYPPGTVTNSDSTLSPLKWMSRRHNSRPYTIHANACM